MSSRCPLNGLDNPEEHAACRYEPGTPHASGSLDAACRDGDVPLYSGALKGLDLCRELATTLIGVKRPSGVYTRVQRRTPGCKTAHLPRSPRFPEFPNTPSFSPRNHPIAPSWGLAASISWAFSYEQPVGTKCALHDFQDLFRGSSPSCLESAMFSPSRSISSPAASRSWGSQRS